MFRFKWFRRGSKLFFGIGVKAFNTLLGPYYDAHKNFRCPLYGKKSSFMSFIGGIQSKKLKI